MNWRLRLTSAALASIAFLPARAVAIDFAWLGSFDQQWSNKNN